MGSAAVTNSTSKSNDLSASDSNDDGLVLATWVDCRAKPEHPGDTPPQPWRRAPFAALECGEDAFFTSPLAVGIADGVGGWRSRGVNPALFSNALMREASALHSPGRRAGAPSTPPSVLTDARATLAAAYGGVLAAPEPTYGTSTAAVVVLRPGGAGADTGAAALSTANLGDSGVMVVRDGAIVWRTQEKQHRFNCPYQLGIRPASRPGSSDSPNDADVATVAVRRGDTIVLATDGVLDNLFPEQIAAMCGRVAPLSDQSVGAWRRLRGLAGGEDWGLRRLASEVVAAAFGASQDNKLDSPFSVHARAAGKNYPGGKPDDITVVVARVVRRSEVDAVIG